MEVVEKKQPCMFGFRAKDKSGECEEEYMKCMVAHEKTVVKLHKVLKRRRRRGHALQVMGEGHLHKEL